MSNLCELECTVCRDTISTFEDKYYRIVYESITSYAIRNAELLACGRCYAKSPTGRFTVGMAVKKLKGEMEEVIELFGG